MFSYTLDNHFKFGYNHQNGFQDRQNANDIFTAEYGCIQEPIKNWRDSNRFACEKIATSTSKKLNLLSSGGTDSETCALSLLESDIDFNITILEFADGLNGHDVSYAFSFCKKHGLIPKIFHLNIQEFWQSREFMKFAELTHCVSPILILQMWLAAQVAGLPIIAQGEPHFKKIIPTDYIPGVSPYLNSDWRLVESERLCAVYKFFIKQNIDAIPGFFQYAPEQFYSYMINNPIFSDLIENKLIGKLGTRTSKNEIIRQFYPEIEIREKYTGIEKIQSLHDQKRAELAHMFPNDDQNFYIDREQLFNTLKGSNVSL